MDSFSLFFNSQFSSRNRWSYDSLKNFRQISRVVQTYLKQFSAFQNQAKVDSQQENDDPLKSDVFLLNLCENVSVGEAPKGRGFGGIAPDSGVQGAEPLAGVQGAEPLAGVELQI
ncbi:Bax inhibitor 1 [Orobanche minor]